MWGKTSENLFCIVGWCVERAEGKEGVARQGRACTSLLTVSIPPMALTSQYAASRNLVLLLMLDGAVATVSMRGSSTEWVY